MPATTEQLEQRLAAAEDAYHRLMIGEQEVSVSAGGFSGTFKAANKSDLNYYIAQLKSELNLIAPISPIGVRGGR